MPEGDTVWYTARRLRTALAGQVLVRSDFRVPRLATSDLTGQTVTEVISRGKHLLIRTDAALTVHTHLKMEGSWRVMPAGQPRRDHRIRLVLANSRWQAVGYLLGIVQLLRTSEEDKATGHLGPDLLGPDWDTAEAVRRLRSRPERAVAEALLDQTNLAGIGNYFVSEILFLRGVSPWRTVGEIDDLDGLVELAQRTLDANKARPHQRATTGDLAHGRRTWTYRRSGHPCLRCGTTIRSGEQGEPGQERTRFWCPRCQS